MKTMRRAVHIVKAIGTLLAIEVFMPGGTLIVLTILLTNGRGASLVSRVGRRVPSLSRVFPRWIGRRLRGGDIAA